MAKVSGWECMAVMKCLMDFLSNLRARAKFSLFATQAS